MITITANSAKEIADLVKALQDLHAKSDASSLADAVMDAISRQLEQQDQDSL